jgi:hypothetical protein
MYAVTTCMQFVVFVLQKIICSFRRRRRRRGGGYKEKVGRERVVLSLYMSICNRYIRLSKGDNAP